MRSGALKVGSEDYEKAVPDHSIQRGRDRMGRPSVAAIDDLAPCADPPLPLVDGAPRFRMTYEVANGIACVGDAVVLCGMLGIWAATDQKLLPAIAGGAGYILVAWISGQYLPRRTPPSWAAVAAAMFGAALGAVSAAFAGLVSDSLLGWELAFNTGHGRSALAWIAVSIPLLFLWRIAHGRLTLAWDRRGLDRRMAVVRDGAGEDVAEALRRDGSSSGFVLAGCHGPGSAAAPAGRLRWPELWADVAAGKVDAVVIALSWDDPASLSAACRAVRTLPVDVWILPPIDSPAEHAAVDVLPGVRLLLVDRLPLSGWRGIAKRLEDTVLGGLLLCLFAPVMLVVAVAVALDSAGPVLLRQRRFGYGNAPFLVYKFRTMFHDRGDTSGARATLPGDSRVTRLGKFLRASSLDELPQLLNVVRGEMSLVGPRPHPVEMNIQGRMYHLVAPDYPLRHRMKPGITGLAQINGFRGLVDSEEKALGRLALDLRYVREWSVGMDLRILAQTVFKGFFGAGAF